ncbi:hypothetical protein J4H86_21950 [Spiractinospora alimapuensis]|uniref:hypothetical protein n=1 Tax=Spiractinospora alimapuensis TaxID=2820884 RepID=UPI001F3A5EBB|nr:hypothetical protein [Spiractinospora alimapuensis]QVQ51437.1 hypothetical protein J4H86_21950 [Spiractinospora alimapuensis]
MPLVLADTLEFSDRVTPGLLGFLVIAAIAVALYFIMRSMRRQFAKIDFEEQQDDRA